jgi:NAD(P)-dependent dehydrogenase (short-subunit alcohol dehydrogenase family)
LTLCGNAGLVFWREGVIVSAGRVAVVTGGAKGIGLATSARLLRDGYRVAVLGRQPELPPDVAASLPGEWQYICADVAVRASVESAAHTVMGTWGQVDALVSNAGIFPRYDSLTMTSEQWDEVLAINLGGTFLVCQAFGSIMMKAGRGAIVTTSSGFGVRGGAKSTAYSASKAGIIALTRSLAAEWAPKIRVNCVVPGITDTAMPRLVYSEESLRERGKQIPLGRIGDPEDVAAAAVFLLSDDAAYITGQCLGVNGGATMF